jgi:FkbM family methyltransferase
MGDVLIVCYHAVSADWPSELAVTPDRLESHLQLLQRRGYRFVTFTEAALGSTSERMCAVTFDDAFKSVVVHGFPVLRRLGIPGTVFVPTDFADDGAPIPLHEDWVGTEHEHELACMIWKELARLSAAGWEIGSHTRSHPRLTHLPAESLHEELRGSREECSKRLHLDCRSLAYPYGDHDDRVVDAARAAGYVAAGTVPRRFESFERLPLRSPRIDPRRSDSMTKFRFLTAAATRRVRASRGWRWLGRLPRRRSVKGTIARRWRQSRRAIALARLCKNWLEVARCAADNRPCSRFVLRSGFDLRFPSRHRNNLTIFDEIFLQRDYTRYFDVEPGDVVVDVGANVGIFAAYALNRGCRRVVCVEPLPANIEAIEQNAARNGFENLVIEKGALDGRRGTAKLYVTDEDSGGNLLFDHNVDGQLQTYVEVPTLTLDDLFERHDLDGVDFLKLDCEGSEGLVFADPPRDRMSRVRRIAMEFHDSVSPLNHEEIVARLEGLGFRTWVDDGGSGFGYIWAERAG